MFAYLWPMALIILSNTLYQVCAKENPAGMHPLATLTVTYLVGALISGILYFVLNGREANLLREYTHLNWAPFGLGLVIVGLEVGYIYAYKAGWPVSTAQIVQAAVIAVLLIFVGKLLYREEITWNRIVGIVICLVGLGFINYK